MIFFFYVLLLNLYLFFKIYLFFNCYIVMFELCLGSLKSELLYCYALRRFCNIRTFFYNVF